MAGDFRSVKKLSPGVALRNRQPVYRGLGALGAGLIFKAVSTAHALGCHEFLATVQEAKKAGKTAEDTAKSWTMPAKYAGYAAAAPARLLANVQIIYTETK